MKRIISLVLAIVLLFSIGTTAFAAISPSGNKYYKVTIIHPSGEKEKFSVKQGTPVELSLAVGEEKDFVKWEISGDYEIISGSLKDGTLVIMPLSDLTIRKVFKDRKPDKDKGETNDSEESPQTGSNLIFILFGVMAASLIMVKTAKNKLEQE